MRTPQACEARLLVAGQLAERLGVGLAALPPTLLPPLPLALEAAAATTTATGIVPSGAGATAAAVARAGAQPWPWQAPADSSAKGYLSALLGFVGSDGGASLTGSGGLGGLEAAAPTPSAAAQLAMVVQLLRGGGCPPGAATEEGSEPMHGTTMGWNCDAGLHDRRCSLRQLQQPQSMGLGLRVGLHALPQSSLMEGADASYAAEGDSGGSGGVGDGMAFTSRALERLLHGIWTGSGERDMGGCGAGRDGLLKNPACGAGTTGVDDEWTAATELAVRSLLAEDAAGISSVSAGAGNRSVSCHAAATLDGNQGDVIGHAATPACSAAASSSTSLCTEDASADGADAPVQRPHSRSSASAATPRSTAGGVSVLRRAAATGSRGRSAIVEPIEGGDHDFEGLLQEGTGGAPANTLLDSPPWAAGVQLNCLGGEECGSGCGGPSSGMLSLSNGGFRALL
jgi:hypothetical protein